MLALVFHEARREPECPQAFRDTKTHLAGHRPADVSRPRNVERGGFHAFDRVDQHFAFGRHPYAVDVPCEQGEADLALELFDVAAQRVNREMQDLRCRAETAASHDFQKRARAFPVVQTGINRVFHMFYERNAPCSKSSTYGAFPPLYLSSMEIFVQAGRRSKA